MMRRWSDRCGLSIRRTISNRAVHRSIDEKEVNLASYFFGRDLTVTLEGVVQTFHAPGWVDVLKIVCTPDGKIFEECPERVINMDETPLNGLKVQKGGVAPKSAKGIGSSGAYDQDAQITAVCGYTYAGTRLPMYYIFEGSRARENWMEHAHSTSAFICRKDGFFMTEEILKDYVQHILVRHQGLQVDNTHRVLLVMDRHSSRTPAVLRGALPLGFDTFVSTAALSALVQLMDQIYGRVKNKYTALNRTYSCMCGAGSLTRSIRVKHWEEAWTIAEAGCFRAWLGPKAAGQDGPASSRLREGKCKGQQLQRVGELNSVPQEVLEADLTLLPASENLPRVRPSPPRAPGPGGAATSRRRSRRWR